MPSARRSSRRSSALRTWVLVALWAPAAGAQTPRGDAAVAPASPTPGVAPTTPALTLAALMGRFAALPGLSARYHEERRMALLAVPLRSEGTLDYAPPSRLLRRTTAPTASFVLIRGGQLQFGDERRRQQIDLAATPAARQFVDSFLGLVAGDQRALERAYEMEFRAHAAHPEGWELTLRPRLSATSQIIDRIVLRGVGVLVDRMALRETNGDETLTVFTQVNVQRRYSPEEIVRIFGTEAR
jgi:hypothetical protein